VAQTSGPFDPVDPENPVAPGETLTEADWELMLQHLIDGVLGGYGSGGLAASPSGSTARGVDFAPGNALTRGHWYKSTAVETLTSAANGAGSSRIDRGVLRLNRTANSVTLALVQGTAGGGIPALADNATVTERPLWRWTIAPGATAVSALTDERQWLAAPVRPCSSTNRPTGPNRGEVAYETDTGRWIGWTGSAWVVLYPVVSSTGDVAVSLAAGWASDGSNTVRRINGVAHVDLNVKFQPAQSNQVIPGAGGSSLVGTIPAGYRPSDRKATAVVLNGGDIVGAIHVQDSGRLELHHLSGDVFSGRVFRVSFSYPL
jgi:hypothetical protein